MSIDFLLDTKAGIGRWKGDEKYYKSISFSSNLFFETNKGDGEYNVHWLNMGECCNALKWQIPPV